MRIEESPSMSNRLKKIKSRDGTRFRTARGDLERPVVPN